MSVLQKDEKLFPRGYVSKMMSQATDWIVTSWATSQWTACFLACGMAGNKAAWLACKEGIRAAFLSGFSQTN